MKPKVIVGDFTGRNESKLQAAGWGRMKLDRSFTPKGIHQGKWHLYRGEPWAMDNGAFVQWSRQGKPIGSGSYDFQAFERRILELERHLVTDPTKTPLFVVAPDLPAQGLDSLIYSLEWIHQHRRAGRDEDWNDEGPSIPYATFPFYLAVQDGMRPTDLLLECSECGEPIWTHFDGIFLGGTDDFKKNEALAWSATAKALQLKFHYARAGTVKKLRHAHLVGADSVDSALMLIQGPRAWDRYEATWRELDTTTLTTGGSHGQLHLWS